jgi:hypothetical protein
MRFITLYASALAAALLSAAAPIDTPLAATTSHVAEPSSIPFNGTGPANNGTDPAYNGTDPVYNGTYPAYNGTDPVYNGTYQAYNGTDPAYNGTYPLPYAPVTFESIEYELQNIKRELEQVCLFIRLNTLSGFAQHRPSPGRLQ